MKYFFCKSFGILSIVTFLLAIPSVGRASMDDGLTAHWNLDEATSTVIVEEINGNDGTAFNDPKHVLGKVGRALLFDAPEQYASIGSAGSDALTSFSISFWMKTTDSSADAIISNPFSGFSLFLCDGGTIGVKQFKDTTAPFCGSHVINNGVWHHIVFTYDKDTGLARVHIDGSPVNSEAQWGMALALPPRINGLRFNRTDNDTSGLYEGLLDDVRVYNRVLNDPTDEVSINENAIGQLFQASLAESAIPPYLIFTSVPADLITVNHAQIAFEAQVQTGLTCKLDGVDFTPCNSPASLTSLSFAPHTFSVTATDGLGTETTITDEFTVEFVPNTGVGNGGDEGAGIIPTNQGTNEPEGGNIIPNSQGANGPEGGAIIPTNQGTNDPEDTSNQQNSNNNQSVVVEAQANFPSFSYGGGGGSSQSIVVASIPSTLPLLTDIKQCSYLTTYLNIGSQNDPTEVTKLQTFLKNTENINVDINGIFDQKTLNAVKLFQAKYLNEIMTPWGETKPSGYVFLTTQKKINELYCKATFSLTPAQIAKIESYRKNLESGASNIQSIEVGQEVEPAVIATTTAPVEVGLSPVQENLGNTQSASAVNAAGGFWSRIVNFFKNLF